MVTEILITVIVLVTWTALCHAGVGSESVDA